MTSHRAMRAARVMCWVSNWRGQGKVPLSPKWVGMVLGVTVIGIWRLDGAAMGSEFDTVVRPMVEEFCVRCHGPEKKKAKFDMDGFRSTTDVVSDFRHFEMALERIESGEMPPEDEPRPDDDTVIQIRRWFDSITDDLARRDAGDPGNILARRLSVNEYNNTIRDLTGVDIQPAADFPVDAANQAGFDNSGESLLMSPGLFSKYIQAAREVSAHLYLHPGGLGFAPHSVETEVDRDRFCVHRIVDFYKERAYDLSHYLETVWRFENREDRSVDLGEFAAGAGVSPKYLKAVHSLVNQQVPEPGPVAWLSNEWRSLAAPSAGATATMRDRFEVLAARIFEIRRLTRPEFDWPRVDGIHNGAQAFVLWMNRQRAATRNAFSPNALEKALEDDEALRRWHDAHTASKDALYRQFEAFSSVFPDRFVVLERGRQFLQERYNESEAKGRYLSAGFHSMLGYFRDDQPLYELILNDEERAELDRLWDELDFIARVPKRQYQTFLWFERTDSRYLRDPEFDFARPEFEVATTAPLIEKLATLYKEKAIRSGAEGAALEAMDSYFVRMNARMRELEAARVEAASGQLEELIDFVRRAYRRDLTLEETRELVAFYLELREREALSHEEAIRELVFSALVSPRFLYRFDLAPAERDIHRLDGFSVANRLSYFLWASMPDERLFEFAREGKFDSAEGMRAAIRYMVASPRIRGFAVEFLTSWLGVRRFDSHNAVDKERYPEFNEALQDAMFEEPVRVFVDLLRRDGRLVELLHSDTTFVNEPLAAWYGLDLEFEDPDSWISANVAEVNRGGLLPMAVFLTKNSPGLRTSPVKRGYWVVKNLLGEEIPAPPPNVPELPEDEASLGELTLAETLARHREHESCAGCHDRFDALGVAYENFGPVGEWRETDFGGRPTDPIAVFPDGEERRGLEGLKAYLREERQRDFERNFCERMLAYALGRSLILSDRLLIDEMVNRIESGAGVVDLIEMVATSRQFLHKRREPKLTSN